MDGLVNVSRRRFLKASGVAGGGLVVGFTLTGCSSSVPPVARLEGDFVPNAFLQITPENRVRFYCPRDEMGQGVNTGLTTLVAEELDVAPWEIEVLWAGVHSDYANPEFGVQGTGGSTSIKAHYRQLRQVGANVRAVLLEAAAGQLGRPVAELSTDGGHVLVDGERLPYGDFVATAAALEAPPEAATKPPSEFKYIGKEFARIDALDKSTGVAEFGIDIDVPGLHHGVVRRCPVAGGTLKSFRDDKARSVPGVTDVVEIGSGVAVVADRYWAAKKGAEALELEWNLSPLADLSTERLQADYRTGLDRDGDVADERGDLAAGFGQASQVVDNEYWAPYLAHAPMEPMNAVVRIEGGEADVWTGCQGIFAAQGLVARFSGLEKSKVRAHNTYLGGGFGRRATLTHVIE
ncbi:MAG: molybdopterin-dependent oxidoreductase, partial [Gammaproteobacteria bacterium]|nr:molybdopterin-dependent oxidoreductase [Gammaproteobacteria bacterium]